MIKTKFEDWKHLITRDLPLVRFYMVLESYIEHTHKEWGWQYSGGCAISKKGIMDIYRRDRYLIKGAKHFIGLKNKNSYLKKLLEKSKSSVKEADKIITLIKRNLSSDFKKKELIDLFEITYKEFKKFWTIQNFTFTLDASFNKTGKPEYLKRYQDLIMEMRELTQGRTIQIEQLIDKIIVKLSKKLKINKLLLENSIPKEIISHNINLKEAKKRSNSYFIIVDGNEIKISSDSSIISKWNKYLGEKSNLNINEIKGKSAYLGVVNGVVRVIINKKDLSKLKKSEILVTPMTEVDYVPYLKKVKAIITNEGGIVCHAAIISRELGIPCIIGTKIATKVLKDGDIVEVNANKGIIKVLKRAK